MAVHGFPRLLVGFTLARRMLPLFSVNQYFKFHFFIGHAKINQTIYSFAILHIFYNNALLNIYVLDKYRFDQLYDYAQKLLKTNPRAVKVKQNVQLLTEAKNDLDECWAVRNERLQQALDLQVYLE